jgi:hypothetical protein
LNGTAAAPDDIERERMDLNCGSGLMLEDLENKPELIETHGFGFYLVPAAVPKDFTGCQVIWLENGHKLVTRHFKAGQLTWVRGQEPKEVRPYFCVYTDGKLNKDASFNIHRCHEQASEMG